MPEIPTDYTTHFGDIAYTNELAKTFLVPHCNGALRTESREESKLAYESAEAQNKPITQEEANMGIRIEHIEREIREALMKIWQKGYTTNYSGFVPRWTGDFIQTSDGLHILQFLSLEEPPEELLRSIWELTNQSGLLTWTPVPYVEDVEDTRRRFPDKERVAFSDQFGDGTPLYLWGIVFVYTGGDQFKLKAHWDLIADTLPDLGWKQLINNTEGAKRFRETHTIYSG